MTKRKFKIGDRVVLIKNICLDEPNIGCMGVVERYGGYTYPYYVRFEEHLKIDLYKEEQLDHVDDVKPILSLHISKIF